MQSHATTSDSATRRHRPKTLTVFAAAFAAGAVLAYGVNRVVDVHVVQVEPQVESEPIFVALRSLPQGSPVTVWDVALKDWPKAMLPTTALKADASFDGFVLRHAVREGQPLLSVQLVRDTGAVPAAVMAALSPVAAPAPVASAPAAGGRVTGERFVPAAPADPLVTAAAAAPAPQVTAESPVAEPIVAPAIETAPVSIAADTPPPEVRAPQAVDVVAMPATDTDIDTPAVAAAVTPTTVATLAAPQDPSVDAPADVAAPTMVAIVPPSATSVVSEPTPAVPDPATVTSAVSQPIVPPVPALPSTDLEQSLAKAGRPRTEPAEIVPSVLDRTTAAESPAPRQPSPRLHLVVPERIALAVDASFTQQPKPAAAVEQQPVSGVQDGVSATTPTVAAGRAASRAPSAANPGARKPVPPARQPAAKPAMKSQPQQSRGLGAWFPQLSGGSRQR